MKKINKALLLCAACAFFTSILLVFYPNLTYFSADKSGTPYQSKYALNESKTKSADIPYEKYLSEMSLPVGKVYDIRDYGASADKSYSENRKAIQTAVDKASADGGGTVLVSGGKYLCANIELKSDVTLFINSGSSLENVTYNCDREENKNYDKKSNGFIFAENCENIVVTGGGKLIGNGETYTNEPKTSEPYYPLNVFSTNTHFKEFKKRIRLGKCHETERYYMLEFNDCSNVTIRNIEIADAGSWTCRMVNNENLLFDKVVINNNLTIANSDGIDILGGNNIIVQNCFISTGDDGVCLKTESGAKSIDGVTVKNCEIMSNANCFKIGTGTYDDIKNVEVRDCYFYRAETAGGYSGIAIEAADGGEVSDITVKNIEMDNVVCPFVVWLGYRHDGSRMKNIVFENITACNIDIAPSITGNKHENIENVYLDNINISYRSAESDLHVYLSNKAVQGLNMKGYPESLNVSSSHGFCYDVPAYELYARNVNGLNLNNVKAVPRKDEVRTARILENVTE